MVVGSVSYSMAARDCGIAGWRCGGESGCRCRRGGVVRGWKTDISTASVCLIPSQIHRRGCIQVSGIHAPAARFMVEYQCCIHDPATTFLRPPTYHMRILTTILRHSHTRARIWHQLYMCVASSRIEDPANQAVQSVLVCILQCLLRRRFSHAYHERFTSISDIVQEICGFPRIWFECLVSAVCIML